MRSKARIPNAFVAALVSVASCGSEQLLPRPDSTPPTKELTSFAFLTANNSGLGVDVTATIDGTSIAATVPLGTNVTSLKATFSTTGTIVSVGGAVQVSGVTANDFTNAVSYRVAATDGSTMDYAATVTGSPCSATFACPQPTAGNKQTICGQIYDFETMIPFANASATAATCATATTSGPCSLSIHAYDAIAYSLNPATATPLANGGVDIDDCGRYRVKDIMIPSGPFIGLAIDDASSIGPSGTTVPVVVTTADSAGRATKDFEAFVVNMSTTTTWQLSGGPGIATGYYAPIYRQHNTTGDLFAPAAGVMFTKSTGTATAQYFIAAQTKHQTVDAAATVTGANGTALVIGANVSDSLAYSGSGGITDTAHCKWETHFGATVSGLVFIQIYRPQNQIGQTCPL